MKNLKTNTIKTYKKGVILLEQGEIAKYGYLVKKGCLKSYTVDIAGKEHILQFAPENWMISDLESFTNQVPSSVSIETIEDCEIALIAKVDFKEIEGLEKEVVIDMANKFRNNLIASNKRILGLLSASSEQRYLDFTETYPTLVQRLPLKLIAAYIGVTPEYLSDIRRRMARK
ncbi:Crp/Fnr family transcriptional regulator [uncultured Cyclobacterium sp.]|uniref:Crp/Fnr family transcriptional regulator n=1 Tax=uncultured Cyclobacterium sp. TaxID=453820 RepID=UPI0030EF57EF|tara:strand:+ start:55008 stop:55526 length:519 start_codon:yes stop_codon:yes gene_type:complete